MDEYKTDNLPDAATPWHALPAGEALARWRTELAGLGEEAASARLGRFGPNRLPEPRIPGLLQLFLHQFRNPLIYILLAAAVASFLIGKAGDAGFIFAVLLFNAAVGTFQEWNAERSSAALRQLLRIEVRVRRGGRERSIDAAELVPGDIVLLESGNKVPADLRLWETNGLLIDEALLTGESLAVEKRTAPVDAAVPVADRLSMAYAGANVTAGRGVGIVVATGMATEVGKLAETVASGVEAKPPLLIRMEKFTRQVGAGILIACFLLGLFEVYQGKPIAEVFFIVVALAVSAIPEGLPIAMTVALSVATRRMARRNVLARSLTAVEGLGSCTLIASDKTGTLTLNKQTVQRLFLYPDFRLEVSGEGYNADGEVRDVSGGGPSAALAAELAELGRVAALCNEAALRRVDGEWRHAGDAVDIAFLALAYKLGTDPDAAVGAVELLDKVPFESERKYAAQFFRADGKVRVAVKGAAEALLPMCACDWDSARVCGPLDPARAEAETARLSAEGYRVLALAVGDVPEKADGRYGPDDIAHLSFLGLAGLIDPLRPEAAVSVATCRQAGIEVVMVTGDHPVTALAIAAKLGIAGGRDEMMTGPELADWQQRPQDEYLAALRRTRVFARVAPLQKLAIVEGLMAAGHFVAVTGDGANDAPALRRANIGVAMGSGTDLAKESADIIITNDNFAAIVAGVEEGRNAYGNVRKVIMYLLSQGAGIIAFFTTVLLLGYPVPLLAAQLLWLNLVANGMQDVALAFEKGDAAAMARPPRSPAEGIFDKRLFSQVVTYGGMLFAVATALWLWLSHSGAFSIEEERSLMLLVLICMGNFHAFNCRSETLSAFRTSLAANPILPAAVCLAQVLHLAATRSAFMQDAAGLFPYSPTVWLYALLLASTMLWVGEAVKQADAGDKPGQG